MIVHPTLSNREFENVETQFERVRACSVNAVDVKIRRGVYEDYPDYDGRVPRSIPDHRLRWCGHDLRRRTRRNQLLASELFRFFKRSISVAWMWLWGRFLTRMQLPVRQRPGPLLTARSIPPNDDQFPYGYPRPKAHLGLSG